MRHNFHARMEWLQSDCLLVCSSFLLFGLWLIFSDAQESLGNKIFRGLLLLFAHILASETWRAFSFYFRDWIWKLGQSRGKAHSKLNHLLNPGSWSGASETWTLLFSVVIIIEGAYYSFPTLCFYLWTLLEYILNQPHFSYTYAMLCYTT